MSEALEKVKGIRHLPIFPLPLILLPSEVIPLHIFEDRYRKMLKDVGEDRNIFGISYFETEGNIDGRPPIESIGCTAEIRDAQMLPDGRSNIVAFGLVRYRLLDFVDAGEPYLIADVEFFEDDAEDEQAMQPLADNVFVLFERVAKAAFKLSGSRGQMPEIPRAGAEQLSFLIAAAFNLENELKYRMLEITNTTERLQKLHEILSAAVSKMEESADVYKAAQSNGHTQKKIDL
jgi:Lon protease-like protein